MKQEKIKLFMDIAERISQESKAERLKVGSIVVKDDRIISIGYNGTPPGWDNKCEYNEEYWHERQWQDEPIITVKTKPEVIHAEANAIAKLARSSESGLDAVMFTTHSPCLECAKTIAASGINTLYYKYDYRCKNGLEHLEKCNVFVKKVE